MNREVRKRIVFSAAALALMLAAGGVPAHAENQPRPKSQFPLAIPNTGRQMNPFATAGAHFVWLNPGVTNRPDWFAC